MSRSRRNVGCWSSPSGQSQWKRSVSRRFRRREKTMIASDRYPLDEMTVTLPQHRGEISSLWDSPVDGGRVMVQTQPDWQHNETWADWGPQSRFWRKMFMK